MNTKWWFAAILLFAGTVAVAANQVAVAPGTTGRYQVHAVAGNDRVIVIDTQSGQCWHRHLNASKWADLGSPVEE